MGFFRVVMGKKKVLGKIFPLLPESAHGFTPPAHHKKADHHSFLVLFLPGKTVCAFCEEESPTTPPSTVTPSTRLPWGLVLIWGLEKTCIRASIFVKPYRHHGLLLKTPHTEAAQNHLTWCHCWCELPTCLVVCPRPFCSVHELG